MADVKAHIPVVEIHAVFSGALLHVIQPSALQGAHQFERKGLESLQRYMLTTYQDLFDLRTKTGHSDLASCEVWKKGFF